MSRWLFKFCLHLISCTLTNEILLDEILHVIAHVEGGRVASQRDEGAPPVQHFRTRVGQEHLGGNVPIFYKSPFSTKMQLFQHEKIMTVTLLFKIIGNFFLPKWVKIVKSNNHNIGPWS
jgi:hypothetical protein